ncbi:MAG: hypothetical protein JWQ44_2338 [Chthoniobacter sp.]|nr:hypothetical protein [Chthoniobacter sp.]
MLYRCVAALIIVFWLSMTGLLLRKELGPSDSALRAIPAEHVLKLMFRHGERSELTVYSDNQRIGRLRVHPQIRLEDSHRVLAINGNVQLAFPGFERKRWSWDGELEMDKLLGLERSHFVFTTRERFAPSIEITLDHRARLLRYATRINGALATEAEFPLGEGGAFGWLQQQLPPELLAALHREGRVPPQLIASQSQLDFQGERIQTYLVALEQDGQRFIEVHVSELGKILQAKTAIGYSAIPEELVR